MMATCLGAWIVFLVVVIYGPILIESTRDPRTAVKVQGISTSLTPSYLRERFSGWPAPRRNRTDRKIDRVIDPRPICQRMKVGSLCVQTAGSQGGAAAGSPRLATPLRLDSSTELITT